MKRISKTEMEFDVLVRAVQPIQKCADDADKIEVFIHYFDQDAELNLVMRGKYTDKQIQYFQELSRNMKRVTIVLKVKE